jgi:hypothetical protein
MAFEPIRVPSSPTIVIETRNIPRQSVWCAASFEGRGLSISAKCRYDLVPFRTCMWRLLLKPIPNTCPSLALVANMRRLPSCASACKRFFSSPEDSVIRAVTSAAAPPVKWPNSSPSETFKSSFFLGIFGTFSVELDCGCCRTGCCLTEEIAAVLFDRPDCGTRSLRDVISSTV